ncbi:glycosyltransferase family 2 protein [Streptomyces sp. AC555_RSS877]|uniref:glycosyltransferase family 2 protein n=1 Tax=Streptomyces sp. AC555_RSS877 TaxID=2823688 RepID=UPI0027E459E6|nr:glycosyltransferase family 2 protein [Streptomyces sp. AC555_RSS877]
MITAPRLSPGARWTVDPLLLAQPAYIPVRVVEIDLARPYEFRGPGGGAVRPAGPVLALVRLHGHPLGVIRAAGDRAVTGGGGPDELWQFLACTAFRRFAAPLARHLEADAAYGHLYDAPPGAPPAMRSGRLPHPSLRGPQDPGPLTCQAARLRVLRSPPAISVIVATHNRPELLRQCLTSLLRMEYPRFEVIVVDNAPADDASERLVRKEYGPSVRYIREPVAGLARAHNRGLAVARGRIAAFTDDDTLVDPLWLSALAETFEQDRGIGCVTGLIVPAELRTAAQAALENHGGFAKGYAPRTWSLRAPPEDPLFPFTAGRFGSGTNMAFRVDQLRALGGFDPATGTGTPAHGGDDLLAFFRVLAAGQTLVYQPDAVVWHRHRHTADALDGQAFGYGAGLGAYLTSALLHEPRMLPALLRRLPRGIRYAVARTQGQAEAGAGWSRRLALLELRGLLYGPFGYLRSRRLLKRDGSGGGQGGTAT